MAQSSACLILFFTACMFSLFIRGETQPCNYSATYDPTTSILDPSCFGSCPGGGGATCEEATTERNGIFFAECCCDGIAEGSDEQCKGFASYQNEMLVLTCENFCPESQPEHCKPLDYTDFPPPGNDPLSICPSCP